METTIDKKAEEIITAIKAQKTELEEKFKGLDGELKASIAKNAETLVDLSEQKKKIEALEIAQKRAAGVVDSKGNLDSPEEIKKFKNFLAKGFKGGTEEIEIKANSVGSDPDGGYAVLPTLLSKIVQRVYETSPIRRYASVITANDTVEILEDNGEVSSGWVSETGSRAATNTAQLGKIIIEPHELYANPQVTQKFLDAAYINVDSWVTTKISDKFGRAQNTAFVTGDGVGKPYGLLSTHYTYTPSSSYSGYTSGTIETVKSGSNGAFTVDGIMDLIGSLKPGYNGTLFLNRRSFTSILKLKDTNNYHMLDPLALFFGVNGRAPMVNYEFMEDITAADGATATIKGAIYGDLSQAYQIVDSASIRILRDPYSNKPYVGFYAIARTGGAVVNFEALKVQLLSA